MDLKPIAEDIVDDDTNKKLIKTAKVKWSQEARAMLERKYTDLKITRLKNIGAETIAWIGSENLNNCFVYEHLLSEYKLNTRTVSYYRRLHEDFDYLINIALELQEMKLARLMLRNKVNTQAAVFVLKNKHGWTEKSHVEVQQNVVDAVQEARQRLLVSRVNNELEGPTDNSLITDIEYSVEDAVNGGQSSSEYTIEDGAGATSA